MRDNVCVGIGGNLIAGTVGYCVGDIDLEYSKKKKILIEASNGATVIMEIKWENRLFKVLPVLIGKI